MTKPSVKYENGLKKALADPLEAAAYLNAALSWPSEMSPRHEGLRALREQRR
jgi:hypothetical protein